MRVNLQDEEKMKTRRQLVVLGALTFAFGAVGFVVSATAAENPGDNQCFAAGDLRAQEKCACYAALKENTIEALEDFLQKYGHSGGTACTALARVSLDRFRPDNDPDIGPPTDGSPYTR
jgi:hypothetical protein